MSRRRNFIDNNKYEKVTDDVDGQAFVDERFVEIPEPNPWKTILFIFFLMIAGGICLIWSILVSIGYMSQDQDKALSLLILGVLMFIPGGYYGFILICVFLKRRGYSMDDIPKF